MPLIPLGWLIPVVVIAFVVIFIMSMRIEVLKTDVRFFKDDAKSTQERLDSVVEHRRGLERKIESIKSECRFWKKCAADYGFPVSEDLSLSEE